MKTALAERPADPTPASTTPSFGYIAGLDGLRAAAVLLVLVAHVGFSSWVPGGFGVTLFFFISGMLITRLLLAEQAAAGRIAVMRFYARRLLRLYPALLAAVAAAALVTVAAGGTLLWGKVLSALFYGANYYGIFVGYGQGREGFDPLAILWSLAVEEQYYMVFPLLCLALASRPRHLARWLAAALLAVLAWRVVLVLHGADADRIYMATDTRIDSILYGAWLTLLLRNGAAGGDRLLRAITRPAVLGLALSMLLATLVWRAPLFRDTLRYSVQGLALMPLVAALCFTGATAGLTRWLDTPALRRMGRWSYSLYLFHPVAIVLAEMAWGPGSGGPGEIGAARFAGFLLTAVPLTFVFAAASYRFVEMPFVRWRSRFGSHPVDAR